jgi:hypothetical protein
MCDATGCEMQCQRVMSSRGKVFFVCPERRHDRSHRWISEASLPFVGDVAPVAAAAEVPAASRDRDKDRTPVPHNVPPTAVVAAEQRLIKCNAVGCGRDCVRSVSTSVKNMGRVYHRCPARNQSTSHVGIWEDELRSDGTPVPPSEPSSEHRLIKCFAEGCGLDCVRTVSTTQYMYPGRVYHRCPAKRKGNPLHLGAWEDEVTSDAGRWELFGPLDRVVKCHCGTLCLRCVSAMAAHRGRVFYRCPSRASIGGKVAHLRVWDDDLNSDSVPVERTPAAVTAPDRHRVVICDKPGCDTQCQRAKSVGVKNKNKVYFVCPKRSNTDPGHRWIWEANLPNGTPAPPTADLQHIAAQLAAALVAKRSERNTTKRRSVPLCACGAPCVEKMTGPKVKKRPNTAYYVCGGRDGVFCETFLWKDAVVSAAEAMVDAAKTAAREKVKTLESEAAAETVAAADTQ